MLLLFLLGADVAVEQIRRFMIALDPGLAGGCRLLVLVRAVARAAHLAHHQLLAFFEEPEHGLLMSNDRASVEMQKTGAKRATR